jgi:hypothetical protein
MRFVLALLGAAVFSTSALAAGYKESKSGDLSDDGLSPTPVKLKVGSNVIDGDFGVGSGGIDRDYFTIKIAAGQELAQIILDPKTKIGGRVSFIGVQKGKQVTVDPNGGSAAGLLGWDHFGTTDEGKNLLPGICNGAGAEGCTPPLGPGAYSFWVQETSRCECHYRFIFNVTGADAAIADEADNEAD